ncbi:MAG: hypothetical protein JOZ46_05595, partial [Candidatus Dormibacteraeota bacterium]|nr:hypothetical protein [Candidatus Dormibacteraeota bacterium]
SLEAFNGNTPITSGVITNPHCTEPVNFAFITLDGKPLGPPSPQQADLETFTTTPSGMPTNPDVLYMNPGDTLKVTIDDVASPSEPTTSPDSATDAGGLRITITDITTGQTGSMVASAANGFMDTNPATCQGNNWSFHALYNTAAQGNQVAWAALEGGVLMQDEIGHGEVCSGSGASGLANQDASQASYTAPLPAEAFADSSVYDVCNDSAGDPLAGQTSSNSGGEGQQCLQLSCAPGAGTTEDNSGTNTYGGRACTSSDSHCEAGDGSCLPQGSRSVTFDGAITGNTPQTFTWSDPVAYCDTARFQNGDLDYDGTPYQTLWPDGSSTGNVYLPNNHPTTFRYIGPFDAGGNPYPTIQMETDAAGSENDCNTTSGANCTIPPYGGKFYPFWSLSNVAIPGLSVGSQTYCAWNFGNDGNPGELDDFGGAGVIPANGTFNSQYATPGSHYKGTLISGTFANPQVSGARTGVIGTNTTQYTCPSQTLSQVSTQPGQGTPEAPWVPTLVLGGLAAVATAEYGRRKRRHTTTSV